MTQPEPAVPADATGFDVDDPVWDVPWLDELRDVPANATWPRLMSVPHPRAVGTYGPDVVAYAQARAGVELRWWQRLLFARLLEHDRHGHLVWRTALITVARQCGKSWALREAAMWRLHQGDRWHSAQDIVHTGKDVGICREIQRPAWAWAKAEARKDQYHVRLVNGQEQVERLCDGSRWMLRAKEAVYGLSASLAIVDEAWAVPPNVVSEGLTPTMAERVDAQLLLISTAHRKATPLMLDRRSVIIADLGAATDLLLEWSAPATADIGDVDAWRAASPHWSSEREQLVADQLRTAQAGGVSVDPDEPDPIAGFTAQWLNWWPARATKTGPGEPLLTAEAWQACTGQLGTVGPGWVALEDNIGEGAAAAFVATDGERFEVDGRACSSWEEAIGLARWYVDTHPGTRTVAGASLLKTGQIPADWPNRHLVRLAGIAETRRALPLLRSLVDAGRIVHDDTHDLDAQIDTARVRSNANGTLLLVSQTRSDLLRAALWALAEASVPSPVPQVH